MSVPFGDAPAVRVSPGSPPARWSLRVPGSKSLTNRALLIAGVAAGTTRLLAPLIADDTEVMMAALQTLGARLDRVDGADGDDVTIQGLGGPPAASAAGTTVDCGMAGTVGRFLVPVLAAGSGRFAVDGHPQLRRRPLGPVLAALRAQGAEIDGESLPLSVTAHGLAGGVVDVDASVSSQFLSGLAIAAPLARAATTLRFGALVSAPYLDLTLEAMSRFGATVTRADGELQITARGYRAVDALEIEPDVSTASYFLASAAVTGTTVTLPGLDLDTTGQGDIELVAHLEAMGCAVPARAPLSLTGPERLRGVRVDMNSSSDVFMTLACVAPFADGPTTITGIGHARVKESDRVDATARNLRTLGIQVEEGPDWLRVHPGTPRAVRLPTFEDHRIAMAFSLIGTRVAIELEDPGVVAKTCPPFFSLWPRTGAVVEGVR
ncbi:MAG TPA: 3-phosphoshikimate 1-carboxyvinyltransferase [Solirubrobacteraceae bacterium]|nr:3-phosphoshikimate 1-carboxyvinyltransferase [Solirubrobacteraceae bacterium]